MPPCAADVEQWWLVVGMDALSRLVDASDLQVNPRECGFAQVVHRKLRAFDNDPGIKDALCECMAEIAAKKAFQDDFNPRRKMHTAMRCIFQKPNAEGIDFARAMDGLEHLDTMEMHRQRLVAATRQAMVTGVPHHHHAPIIQELERQTTFRYRQFHLGFRACILMEDLAKVGVERKSVAEIMARFNSLFPAFTFVADSEDVDLIPYSTGLRDSVRFSVFEHLMSDNPASEQAQRAIHMKLFCWCDIPGYVQAWEAMMRYSEEVKKLESTCLEALGVIERRSMGGRPRGSSTGSSFVAVSSDSKSPTVCAPRASTPGSPEDIVADMSFPSTSSNRGSAGVNSAPPVPNPLLKGMPGREISAAKTDGAAFAGDHHAPPILTYPEDLSTTEFDQHSLAKDLGMTSQEKAQLGLIIPKQIPNRDFYAGNLMPKSPARAARHARRLAKAKLEKKKMDKDAPPVPPLPPIPESLRSTLTPKGLAKLFERTKGRRQSDEAEPLLPSTAAPLGPHERNATISSAFSRGKLLRPLLTTQISNPELRSPGRLRTLQAAAGDAGKPFGTSPAETTSPTIAFPEPAYARVQKSNARYRLAPPRLSPMEYTRMYLIEKAQAEREVRPCELPAPEKLWRWTPKWENFLIVPVVPPSINRNFAQMTPPPDAEQDENGSDAESTTTLKLDTPTMPCPRLSLNLGGMTAFFPSVMNLARLGMSGDGDADPPASSSEAYVNQLRRSRSFTVCRRTLLISIAEEYPQEGHVSLHTPTPDDNGGTTGDGASASMPHSSRMLARQDHETGLGLAANDAEAQQENAEVKDGDNESPQEAPSGTPSTTHGQAVPYDRAGTMAWLDRAESSSLYSDRSAKTAVHVGVQEQRPRSDTVFTPTSSPDIRSRAGLSPSHSSVLSPALERPVVEYSPASKSASMSLSSIREAPSPLARFAASPCGRGPTRDSPVSVKERVKADGGNLRAEEPRRAKLVQSTSSGRVKSTAADIRTTGSGVAMASDLQPAPLKVRKQRSSPAENEAERCSRMWQGLSDEINEKLTEFSKYERSKVNDEKLLERSAQLGPLTPLETSKVRHLSLEGGEELAERVGALDTEQTKPKLQRAASALMTPTKTRFALETVQAPSFTIADGEEPSGFTPRQSKPGATQAAIPDSPTLPSIECSLEGGEGRSGSETMTHRRRRDEISRLLACNIPRPMDATTPTESCAKTGPTKVGPRTSAGSGASGVDAPAERLASKDSSFTLDKSKGEDSVTILPRVRETTDGCRGRHSRATTTSATPRSYFDHSPERKVRKKLSAIDALTPLAFQRFDTAARLASAVTRRDFSGSTSSPPADRAVRPGRAPSSAFGNLFRKYSRAKADDSEPTTPKSPPGPAVHWRPFEETGERPAEGWMAGRADSKARAAETISEDARGGTKPRDQRRLRTTSGSHSHNNNGGSSSGGAAGFKDKTKRRMALQAGRKPRSEETAAGFKSFVDDRPPPPPTSPLPPLPPATSELKGPAYKAKKPLGLWVDTGAAGEEPPRAGKEAMPRSRNAAAGPSSTG
ncbi:Uncharacterized protein TCAP_06621, partial [Tolypocladium capitatum]